MNVEVIAVGNEVVGGHVVNTNAAFLAREVQALGMCPRYMNSVRDDQEDIKEAIALAVKRSDWILVTGGLGPTPDDLTKETVCEVLGFTLEVHAEEIEKLEAYFKQRGRQMSPNNEKQAYFPRGARILPNDCGTAPGCLIERDGKRIVLLPGPPKEMKQMFLNYVLPIIKECSDRYYAQVDIKCFGIGESELAMRIEPFLIENEQVSVATYIGNGEVIVRISAYSLNEEMAYRQVEAVKMKIELCLNPWIIGYNEDKLEEQVVRILREQQLTISTVESCTGGLIAGTLVNCGGVSSCFKEAIVTYSNEAKMKYVGVQKETLEREGAVSEQTAREMAEGIRRTSGADIGLAATGIAGPDGGTPHKPVGLVYIGIAMPQRTEVFKLQLKGDRQEVRERTVKHILFQLYKMLL